MAGKETNKKEIEGNNTPVENTEDKIKEVIKEEVKEEIKEETKEAIKEKDAEKNAEKNKKKKQKDDETEFAVKIENLTIRYNLATERIDTFKEKVIRTIKGTVHFQNFFPVKDVSLTIKPGEAWGFVGVNGAGKSTILKAICGILDPYRGSVEVNGSISPLLELGAGFESELSGRDNIFMNGTMLGYSLKFMKSKYDEIVEFADLGDFIEVPVKNYSSGMRSRLGFAIATVVKPDILVVDEVLAVGDLMFQRKCQARMKELISGGTTLLFVSHSEQTVKNMCDHAAWLENGHCVMAGEVNSVVDAYVEYHSGNRNTKK